MKLGLRQVMPWDAERLFSITGDPAATRFMGFKTHQTVGDAAELIKVYSASTVTHLAVCPAESPADLLGVGWFEIAGHQATAGLMLNLHDRRAWGAGRKVWAPFIHALLDGGLRRVWSYVHVDNIPSQRATERMGAEREGLMRKYSIFPNVSETEPQDCYLYGLTK